MSEEEEEQQQNGLDQMTRSQLASYQADMDFDRWREDWGMELMDDVEKLFQKFVSRKNTPYTNNVDKFKEAVGQGIEWARKHN